jgi:membrane protease YdiL (CAAX protease family)
MPPPQFPPPGQPGFVPPYWFPYTAPTFQPPPPRRGLIALIISWTVILGVTMLILVAPLLAPTPATSLDEPNIQLKFAGRYAIGIKLLFPQVYDNISGDLRGTIEQSTLSSTDQIRAIPLLVETDGRESAGKFLDYIDEDALTPELREDFDSFHTIYTMGSSALSPEQRQKLIDRHEWFAQLALTQDQPGDSPQRQAVLLPAKRMVIVLGLFIVIGGLAFLLGIVLLIIAIVKIASGRRSQVRYDPYSGRVEQVEAPPLTHYRPDPSISTAFLEAFAIYLGGFLVMSLIVELAFPKAGLMMRMFALAIPVGIAIIWPRLRGLPWLDVRRGLGLTAGRGVASEIVSGVGGYLAGLPLIAIAMLVTVFLSTFFKGGQAPSHPIVNEITSHPFGILKLYILASLWAPVSEEIMFRGAFFHHLRRGQRWIISTLIVSFIFAAIHPQGLLGIPMLMTIATIFSALREWRGSVIAPMVAHALNNFVATTLLIMMLA